MSKNFGILLVVVILICTGVLLWAYKKDKGNQKIAYILTQKVFEGYNGTKELKKKLNKMEQEQKQILDSMLLEVKVTESRYGVKDERTVRCKEKYNRVYQQLVTSNQGQVEKYNEGIWKQINTYLTDYGRMKGYSFIYGANGNGSIMYADSTQEISSDVIPYLNKRYSGE